MTVSGKTSGAGALLLVLAATSGCSSPDHIVADRGDLLTSSPQNRTLGEIIGIERGADGCLQAGRRGTSNCEERIEDLSEVLGPPPPLPPLPESSR